MTFVVLEGFSGSGKTTLALELEKRGWVRLPESAHVVPRSVPVADRADTFSDYCLFGATMGFSSAIARSRERGRVVSEGYLLGDLAYAKIRFELKKSDAYPVLLRLCKDMLSDPRMRPDLYVRLEAGGDTIGSRQAWKGERERNVDGYFKERFYPALGEVHTELGESEVERVRTDSDKSATLERVLAALERRGAWRS